MTKKQRAIVEQTNRHFRRGLYECYNKPSARKVSIWNTIAREMYSVNGGGLTVVSYNAHMFTCSYLYEDINVEAGEVVTWMVYHTPNKCERFRID